MAKKNLEELETEIKSILKEFKNPRTPDSEIDEMMGLATKDYIEYLGLSMKYCVPIKERRPVTKNYLKILNEFMKREEDPNSVRPLREYLGRKHYLEERVFPTMKKVTFP